MKQHRFLVTPSQIDGDLVTFSTEQRHQLQAVLRLRSGDRVRVFDGSEPVDRVVELAGVADGRVVETRPQAAEPRTRLVVYPALLQRDTFEPVLQKLTEIGAAAILPLLTARGVVRKPADDRRQTRWRAILREAAEQCGRGVVPELSGGLRFVDAIARATAEGTVLVAYEGEKHRSVRAALGGAQRTVSLFVGPEGGFAPEEADCAADAGARLVTLGPRILRSETASPLLAALVLHELGDLSCADDDA
ncbi:MAG TPA: RsmE family RNA methyltransferase [Chloroflexota bacterium]|nr:RsmE family RNA methyltransferase [Chloroflexota bacterium]